MSSGRAGSDELAAAGAAGVDVVGAEGGGSAGGQGLGARTAAGFVVLSMQTVGVRVMRLLSNIALGWLLFPDDFALFAFATSVHQFVSVLQNAGLREVLIRRQAKLSLWLNAAVWMSAALGLGAGVLLGLLSPGVAWFFDRPELVGLVLVLACSAPFNSLAQVPTALLYADLRFNAAAVAELLQQFVLISLTVLYAWAGFGAMSFVVPILIASMVNAAFVWRLARPAVRMRPQFRRWRYLAGDSARVVSAGFARTLVLQGDYLVLGRLYPNAAAVGQYFYGFRLSRQAVGLFAKNLDLVLLPSLSKLQEDADRQGRAFVSAVRALAIVGVPLCFLQAAVAWPLVSALLPERFQGTAEYIAVLSVGAAIQLLMRPSTSMLNACGRFSLVMGVTWVHAGVFMVSVGFAAWWFGVLGAAFAVTGVTAVFGVVFLRLAISGVARPWSGVRAVLLWPVVLGGVACGAGWLASGALTGDGVLVDLGRAALIAVVSVAVYVPMIALLERETCSDVRSRVSRLLGSKLRRSKRSG